jgi:hypothetical protein
MKIKGYDVIGDVHGKLEALKELLGRLGYRPEGGVWRNPERKAVFIGDLVDRGPDVAGVLALVKAMVDADEARVVMGNHEYGLLGWYSPNGKGGFRRRHKEKYLKYMKPSLDFFEANPDAREVYLEWFRSMPLAVEIEGARFVHAYWSEGVIRRIGSGASLKDLGWNEPVFGNSKQRRVNVLLKGPEVKLPEGKAIVDRQGYEHQDARLNWWMIDQANDLREAVRPDSEHLAGMPIPEKARRLGPPAPHEPPVFFGHFGFSECPGLLGDNLACVDFQGKNADRIGAYRWSGEQKLNERNLVVS